MMNDVKLSQGQKLVLDLGPLLAFFLANQIVGQVGGWYSSWDTVSFWLFHVATAVVGLIAFAAFKMFLARRLMGDGSPAGAPTQ